MRKTINILALIFFVWLVLDTLRAPELLMNFLLVGAIPGSSTNLSPNTMIALMMLAGAALVLDFVFQKLGGFRHMRDYRNSLALLGAKRERLPKRRFNRI